MVVNAIIAILLVITCFGQSKGSECTYDYDCPSGEYCVFDYESGTYECEDDWFDDK